MPGVTGRSVGLIEAAQLTRHAQAACGPGPRRGARAPTVRGRLTERAEMTGRTGGDPSSTGYKAADAIA